EGGQCGPCREVGNRPPQADDEPGFTLDSHTHRDSRGAARDALGADDVVQPRVTPRREAACNRPRERAWPNSPFVAEAKPSPKRERVRLAGIRDAWKSRRQLPLEAKPMRRRQVRVVHEVRARRIEDSVVAPEGRVHGGTKAADSKDSPLANLRRR